MIVDKLTGSISSADAIQISASSNSPPQALPAFGNRAGLIRALEAIGFTNLAGVTALAAAGKPLGSGGAQIDVYELDVALKKFQLDVSRRIQFKTALSREGLL